MPRLTGPPLLWLQFEMMASKYSSILHIYRTLALVISVYLFPMLKQYLKGQRFEGDEAVVAAAQQSQSRSRPCLTLDSDFDSVLDFGDKSIVPCLGRCDLPKHECFDYEDVKPGRIPRNMGWLYNAKSSPQHQLRCGWRPGHIACPVLRMIEKHNCWKARQCSTCKSCCAEPCLAVCCTDQCFTSCKDSPSQDKPLIRIIRHGGQYTISTKPSNIDNSPYGPYPLKYVLNTEDEEYGKLKGKYSVEAKYNDYCFDYTCSQASFVLDFTPPETKCQLPC
ncbi:hypothetical protein EVAR_46208_1 [Eumeta japonica]|uniref:Uncharacterized protein n=1 Tax=Eumeta variegata TaxID=151549 RepID=A0A4C1WE84_EUMVA|nr:hypothetical protein EVAR_46208_1 [Eumeta japonica]